MSALCFPQEITLTNVDEGAFRFASVGHPRCHPACSYASPLAPVTPTPPSPLPRHIGQAEIAALDAKCQPLVIDAEQLQHRRVQIVDLTTFSTAL